MHSFKPAQCFREQALNLRLVLQARLLFGERDAAKLANELGLFDETTAIEGAAARFQARLPPGARPVMTPSDALDHMAALSETLPGEGLWAAAANMLSDLIGEAQLRLSEEEVRILIGIGSLIYRQGQRDFEPGGVLSHVVAGSKAN